MNCRNLYKVGGEKLGHTANKLKRKDRVNEERTLRRNNLFQAVRNIKESPAKENEAPLNAGKKVNKREALRKRFLAWKAEKEKKKEEEKKNKPIPFYSAVKSFAPKDTKFEPPAGLKCHALNKDKVPKTKKIEWEVKKIRNPPAPLKNLGSPKRKDVSEKSLKKPVNTLKPPKTNTVKNIVGQTPKENDKLLQNSFVNRFTSTIRKTAPIKHEPFCDEEIISPIEVVDALEPKTNAEASTEKEPCKNTFFSPKFISNKDKEEADSKKVDLNVTPKNDNTTQNYVSPFVTVSRGKVSNKKEKEKRESIYRLEVSSPGEPIHIRRARESIKYFRTVLNDEIERLLAQCKVWEDYQAENLTLLEECGCDMINATIGQTKLLTSKKLEQFRDLIDRCEDHVIVGSLKGSLQSVLPEDLEGFWSMVRLQIENVDKRFENLERWKANEWCDPEEVKQKTKKLITMVSKAKKKKLKPIKSNEVLKELLKKAHTAYKQSKKDNACIDTDIILVTKKRRSSNAARRSASNTPLRRSKRLETPKRLDSQKQSAIGAYEPTPRPRKSTQKQNSPKNSTPKRSIVSRPSLLVEALSNSHASKSKGNINKSHTKPRKSILKTPGTAKKDKRAVFFNEQLNYKSPEAFSAEHSISGIGLLEQTHCEERSLNLRSRRLILRPYDEIDIP